MNFESRKYRPSYIIGILLMSFYFVFQLSIQNYIDQINDGIVIEAKLHEDTTSEKDVKEYSEKLAESFIATSICYIYTERFIDNLSSVSFHIPVYYLDTFSPPPEQF